MVHSLVKCLNTFFQSHYNFFFFFFGEKHCIIDSEDYNKSTVSLSEVGALVDAPTDKIKTKLGSFWDYILKVYKRFKK